MFSPEPKPATVYADEPFLNESSTTNELAELLPEPSASFEAWLQSLKSSSSSNGKLDAVSPHHQLSPDRIDKRQGELRFEGTLWIDCYVAWAVRSQTGTLVVTEPGEIEADSFVSVAIIEGVVRGNIRATERVELAGTAKVFGGIETPALSIQPGAVFEGRCRYLPRAGETGVEDRMVAGDQAEETRALAAAAGR